MSITAREIQEKSILVQVGKDFSYWRLIGYAHEPTTMLDYNDCKMSVRALKIKKLVESHKFTGQLMPIYSFILILTGLIGLQCIPSGAS